MADLELRPPRDEDAARMAALHNEESGELGDPPYTTAEDVVFELETPGLDRSRDATVAVLGGSIVGYGVVFPRAPRYAYLDAYVAREARGRGVGATLLDWSQEATRGRFEALFATTPATRSDGIALMESRPGAVYARSLFQMRLDDPSGVPAPVWPAGIRLEALTGESLARAATEAYDASFVDHWNYVPADYEQRRHWVLEDPVHDPGLWMIAYSGDAVAGFCVCYVEESGATKRGTVMQLGTSRGFRGIGLGRALLLEGVARLALRGATVVELDVDAGNRTGALQLYRAVGFDVRHEYRMYRLPL